MTNFERWKSYTDGSSSPDNYLNWCWRFVITSALQRRVWLGWDDNMVFANLYMILVGKAGLGKGMAIKPAMELLRYHKLKRGQNLASNTLEQSISHNVSEANFVDAQNAMVKSMGDKQEPPLFPYAPDATTFEALVRSMGKSFRRIDYKYVNGDGHPKMGIYGHCSMYFALPELSSLLRKRTEDTVNYLLGVYDCPPVYEYVTKNKGEDRVSMGCINLLAGTTPDFMEEIFNDKLLNQGFSSRAFFIHASKNRKNVFLPPPLSEEQKIHKEELLKHIKILSGLYGEVKIAPETRRWLENWWNEYCEARDKSKRLSPKLDAYDARKNLHVLKVAMANHFGESDKMEISLEEFQQAIKDLEEEEKSMHLALSFEGENPLGMITDKILEHIQKRGRISQVDLLCDFWKNLPNGKESLKEVISYLGHIDKVREVAVNDSVTKRVMLYYEPTK